jgi:predicted hydrocarbon binding protein
MAGGAQTKGTGFLHVRAFTIGRFGADGWDAVLSTLSPDDRFALQHVISLGWYPLPLYARLLRALDEVHGCGDLALVVQNGRYQAEKDIGTVTRLLLRMAHPHYCLEKFGEFWRKFHDTGRWDVSRVAESTAAAQLHDWGHVDHALCRELIGYFGKLLELVGARHVVVEHPRCRGRGDDGCFFQARWGMAQRSDQTPDQAPVPGDEPGQRYESGVVMTPRDSFAASVAKLTQPSAKKKVSGDGS